jgi:LmbE family N-acetylglucosaminyl deacetylase
MQRQLTLMTVHAHPDDESISTGGLYALCADRGIRTVLVTCTGGEAGEIAPDTLPEEHDLAEARERELLEACGILGIQHLEMLGYRDSGMDGTDANGHQDAFANVDVEVASRRLASLIRAHRPDVLITYDEYGFYGHPDHIMANRITVRAFALSADRSVHLPAGDPPWSVSKLYYTAVPYSRFEEFGRELRQRGIEPPLQQEDDSRPRIGTPDHLVTTFVDVSAVVERKRRALWTHRTQLGPDVFFSKLPPELFDQLFATEAFQLVESRVQTRPPEFDVFDGVIR